MAWRDDFLFDFGKYLGLTDGAYLDDWTEETNSIEGCDTCGYGGGVTFEIWWNGYTADGKRISGYREGSVSEFLKGVDLR